MAEKPEEKAKSPNTEEQDTSQPDTVQLDEIVSGPQGARLRNLSGFLAVLTICVTAFMRAWTELESVRAGHGFGDRMTTFIYAAGPILVAFSFMNVNKILRLLVDSSNGRSVIEKIADAAKAFRKG